MRTNIAYVTLIVKDYDEAVTFYTQKLGFRLMEDTRLTADKRWVLVGPPGGKGPCLLLAKAATKEQQRFIGNQTGGRVFLFLHTDNFEHDYKRMLALGIHFLEQPRNENYGKVAVFEDLYGNKWDLLQLKTA